MCLDLFYRLCSRIPSCAYAPISSAALGHARSCTLDGKQSSSTTSHKSPISVGWLTCWSRSTSLQREEKRGKSRHSLSLSLSLKFISLSLSLWARSSVRPSVSSWRWDLAQRTGNDWKIESFFLRCLVLTHAAAAGTTICNWCNSQRLKQENDIKIYL